MNMKVDGEVDLLPVKNDYVFANLFGKRSHERVLVCLLNAILNGKPIIKSVRLDQTEYKKNTVDGKSVRLDISATSDDGTKLHIEMQCRNEGNIADRASFLQSKLRENELHEGENYSNIPNIISIWICVESVTKRKGCCHEIVPMYKKTELDPVEVSSEKMRLFIIELSKLETTPKQFLNDMFSVWMMFIKDPKSLPKKFLSISEVKEAMDELTYMSADQGVRAEYQARVKALNDITAGQTVKYIEGLEKGKVEGAQKEREKTISSIIEKIKSKKITFEMAQMCYDFSEEELSFIKKTIQLN